VGQTVWTQKQGISCLITLRVKDISDSSVCLSDGLVKISLVLSREGDRLGDKDTAPVALYEYLGEQDVLRDLVAEALMQVLEEHLRRSRLANLN
jgi:hypothetical protein